MSDLPQLRTDFPDGKYALIFVAGMMATLTVAHWLDNKGYHDESYIVAALSPFAIIPIWITK